MSLILNDITVTVPQQGNQISLLEHLDLTINHGDFVSIVGTNGAGKSTLFETISGRLPIAQGTLLLDNIDITKQPAVTRAKHISRVFQDPKLGTAPRMTVGENLLLAQKRGNRPGLRLRQLKQAKQAMLAQLAKFPNNLSEHFDTPTGNLSGGQRQTLSLLMATAAKPELLLLDEHTAALDPKTSNYLMTFTNQIVTAQHLTCLMITHQLDDALTYGNRLLVLHDGKIVADYNQEAKQKLTKAELLAYFDQLN